jgi:hypothetical protein
VAEWSAGTRGSEWISSSALGSLWLAVLAWARDWSSVVGESEVIRVWPEMGIQFLRLGIKIQGNPGNLGAVSEVVGLQGGAAMQGDGPTRG